MKVVLSSNDNNLWVEVPNGDHWLMTWDEGAQLPCLKKGDYNEPAQEEAAQG